MDAIPDTVLIHCIRHMMIKTFAIIIIYNHSVAKTFTPIVEAGLSQFITVAKRNPPGTPLNPPFITVKNITVHHSKYHSSSQ